MLHMPDEKNILELDENGLTLTTHRVRLYEDRAGHKRLVSILFE